MAFKFPVTPAHTPVNRDVVSSPGSLIRIAGGVKRESLVHIVCACANYLRYYACMHYPRKYTEVSIMGVYKIQKYPKMYWRKCRYARCIAAHTTASNCLLGQSLAKLVAIELTLCCILSQVCGPWWHRVRPRNKATCPSQLVVTCPSQQIEADPSQLLSAAVWCV